MSEIKEILIQCTHCQKWIKSPIKFKDSGYFDSAKLIGNTLKCSSCGKETGCNKENMWARLPEGDFLGEKIKILKTEQNIEKQKDMYEYAKEVLYKEQGRFHRIDQKAAWHLSALTVLIGISGFFVRWAIENLMPALHLSFAQGLLEITGFLACIFLVSAWFFFFWTLRLHDLEGLPLDQEVLQYFSSNRRIDIHYHLAETCRMAYEANRSITNRKAQKLAWGYRLTICAVSAMLIFSGSYLWYNSIGGRDRNSTVDIRDKKPIPVDPLLKEKIQ